jgi:flagellar biogenesis protein FliO
MTLLRPTILFARIGVLLAGGLSGLAAAAPAPAAAVQPEAPLSATGEVLGILLPLALIIIALFAVLYFVRRRFGLTGQDAPLTILQILPVGSRERVVLVKSRSGRLFVIGVGTQSVTLITNLEQSDIETPAVAQSSPLQTPVI